MIAFTIIYDENTKQGSMMGNCTGQQAIGIIQNLVISSAVAKAAAHHKSNGKQQILDDSQPNDTQPKLL